MKVVILFTEYDKNLKETIKSLNDNMFDDINLHRGIIRPERRSKIVMDSWKEYFSINIEPQDILIMEDDVIVKINKYKLLGLIDIDKINYCFYQNLLKKNNNKYAVGSQGIFIPKEKYKSFIDKLNNSNSIHFDKWLSQLNDIKYIGNPKEYGKEIPHKSKLFDFFRK
tara:strand:+ start:63 stop:566 length:504 start_codon:yes stop_codon:yes gene_type:complete